MTGATEADAQPSPWAGDGQPPRAWTHDELWQRLRHHADNGARAALIEAYRPFARTVAATYYGRRVTDEIAFDDYHQWSLLGMIESVDRFDPQVGVKFETFASRRMHGRIVDGIESSTEMQQQIAGRRRLRAARLNDIKAMAREKRGPASNQVPVPDEDLLGYLAEVGMGLAVALMLEGTGMAQSEAIAEARPESGYERVELQQVRSALNTSIGQLNTQEQSVIRSHYLHHHPFEDICTRMQLSKGRISQIHRQALGKLRDMLSALRFEAGSI
jgi:RNA polymerase sigma factor for flagellar operon FliA